MDRWRTLLTIAAIGLTAGCSAKPDAGPSNRTTATQRESEGAAVPDAEPPATQPAPPPPAPSPPEEPGSPPTTPDAPAGETAPRSAIVPRMAFPEDAPAAPEQPAEAAAVPEPADDHLVKVYYATDRAPLGGKAVAEAASRRPYFAAAFVGGCAVLCGIAAFVLVRRTPRAVPATLAVVALVGAIAAVALAQGAALRSQRAQRLAEFGDRAYGSRRNETAGVPTLEVGTAEVRIPPDHRVGVVESPSVLRLEFREDPNKHVVLERVVRRPEDVFFRELRGTVAASEGQQAFVFVHGYNVAFEDAVKRTGQIAFDLKFDGAAICYSWPSRGGLAQYTRDETEAGWTVPQLETFLRAVVERTGARTVHLVAHSMGNRALTAAVERLSLRGEDAPRFGRIVLAAPDVDAGEFRSRYLPALSRLARRVTLYASSNDRALRASTEVHGYDRAGMSGEFLVIAPGLETVDVSPIDTSLIGHSYYGDNPLMIRDMRAVLGLDLPAEDRLWLRRTLRGRDFAYWTFRKDFPLDEDPL